MKEIEFLVQGSSAEPYRVTFIRGEHNLAAFCTCPAGENGMYCKHRFAILAEDGSAITSKNGDQLVTVREWLSGTALEVALIEIAGALHEYDAAKNRLADAKRTVAQAMRNKS